MDMKEKLVELKKVLRECLHFNYDEFSCNMSLDVDLTAENLIAHGVTVQEWISVKDRLPEKGEIVLACGLRHATSGMFQGASRNNPRWWHWKGNTLKEVTHWMPLPEPPKEETQPDCTYNKNGHCIGQKLMPECDAKNCDRRN